MNQEDEMLEKYDFSNKKWCYYGLSYSYCWVLWLSFYPVCKLHY